MHAGEDLFWPVGPFNVLRLREDDLDFLQAYALFTSILYGCQAYTKLPETAPLLFEFPTSGNTL